MKDETKECREPQVTQWIYRLENTTEKALVAQRELRQRLAPILRDEPVNMKGEDEAEVQELVPTARVLREICRMVERIVGENERLVRILEI